MKEQKSLQNRLMNSEEPFMKMTLAEKVLDEKEDLQAYERKNNRRKKERRTGKKRHCMEST